MPGLFFTFSFAIDTGSTAAFQSGWPIVIAEIDTLRLKSPCPVSMMGQRLKALH
jgi:hypothetical protein